MTWPVPALFAALSIASSLVVACATGSTTAVKYPRRKPGCAIAIIHEAVPPVREWDDIGLVEVGCYLDEGPGTCLTRLKAEGCRMGGDMIYDVPKRPARPNERAIVYRGHVAHSKTTAKPEPEEPAPASGPVVPIAAPATTEPEADAGVTVTADGAAADATLTP